MPLSKQLQSFINNEAESYPSWLEVRSRVESQLAHQVDGTVRGSVLSEWKRYMDLILTEIVDAGIDWTVAEPGHSIGHFIRDALNALRLMYYGKYPHYHMLVGGLAGVFHDSGTYFTARYEDSSRVIRHAEATALVIQELVGSKIDDRQLLEFVMYAIGAHTNYHAASGGKPIKVKCNDGKVRTIQPYVELDANGKPQLFVHLPRWIDRIETTGAIHFARHYLTLAQAHEDFSRDIGFYDTSFAAGMRPIVRKVEDIQKAKMKGDKKGTSILEHIRMFGDSQNNQSAYGKYDYGFYRHMRDQNKQSVYRILNANNNLQMRREEVDRVIDQWHMFLGVTIEPTRRGIVAAQELREMFDELPKKDHVFWAKTFTQAMRDYIEWYQIMKTDLQSIGKKYYTFEPLEGIVGTANMLEIIKPGGMVERLAA